MANEDQELKADAGKLQPSLFDEAFPNAVMALSRVLEYGDLKYERGSWKEVSNAVPRYTDAAGRHRLWRLAGEYEDTESGLPHFLHEVWNNMAVLELLITQGVIKASDFETFNEPPTDHKKKASKTKNECCHYDFLSLGQICPSMKYNVNGINGYSCDLCGKGK